VGGLCAVLRHDLPGDQPNGERKAGRDEGQRADLVAHGTLDSQFLAPHRFELLELRGNI
jgi:hypothetical protein